MKRGNIISVISDRGKGRKEKSKNHGNSEFVRVELGLVTVRRNGGVGTYECLIGSTASIQCEVLVCPLASIL